jgi:hypothetical protein
VREELEHEPPLRLERREDRCNWAIVIARFSSAGSRPVPLPSGTTTRTPFAAFERSRPSSIASPMSARRTATCWRIVDFDSSRPVRGSRCSTSQRTKALTSRGWISASRSRRTPSK